MEQHASYKRLPIVYACAGCRGGSHVAHQLAVRLDQEQIAEMSCIAGLGADVPAMMRIAHSGRPIIALDGCQEQCVLRCLRRHRLAPTLHYDLSEFESAGRRSSSEQETRRVIADLYDVLIATRPGAPNWQSRVASRPARVGAAEEHETTHSDP